MEDRVTNSISLEVKLIVEMVLLGNVESASQDETDALATTAKRHRVDVVKVSTAVEAEVSAKQAKSAAKQKKVATTVVAKSIPAA